MLITGDRLIHAPVLGLQTGGEIARTREPVINSANLKIMAYTLEGPLLNSTPSLLRIIDIREISDIGLIVDSSDEFVAPEDIVSLNDIYDKNFTLIGMTVIDENKHKLGKVNGYTINSDDFVIQQLSVRRPFLKSFSDTELLVHRSQITEINDKAIVIHSESETPEPLSSSIRTSYVNPFRGRALPDRPAS